MTANRWYSAVKEAIRVTQQQTSQYTPWASVNPLSVKLELEDSIALSEHQPRSDLQPAMTWHDLHAERAIAVPVNIASISSNAGLATTMASASAFPEQSFLTAMPQAALGSTSRYPNSSTILASNGFALQAGARGTRGGSGLKPVCVRCHDKKKKCEGVFPCKLCRTKDEDCVERVSKRKRKIV
ncbi:hypothetical protein K466DRAFT_604329 [Polyporus arcularius HHB13444]|uniref:Zn(2)-C6 fungal-type domain-containing protein n=1 Tax=Polyporus arcularius HHB13444 TaxID=1314778 RepID=A0A5C3NWB0_9APHY|nr:hypothetical protein K466DRAFT_604329 [Polyporus arcularius HHB13444]